jgi:hypothetical protein
MASKMFLFRPAFRHVWASRKLVEFLYTSGEDRVEDEKRIPAFCEATMRNTTELTPEQEAQAQELAEQVTQAIAADVLRMARLLVSKDTRHTFGRTEFQLRDLLHRAGTKVLQTSLAQKKTATEAPV